MPVGGSSSCSNGTAYVAPTALILCYSMPGAALSALHLLAHLILTVILLLFLDPFYR